jgi:hypothetical protein
MGPPRASGRVGPTTRHSVETCLRCAGESPDRSWNVATFDVHGAGVFDTFKWAQDQIGDLGQYAFAVVGERIDMSEEFRGNAKLDSDLDAIRDQRAYGQLIGD